MTAGPRVLHALLNECAPEHRYLTHRKGPGTGPAPRSKTATISAKGPSGAGRNSARSASFMVS